MKFKSFLFLAALSAFAVASCNKNEQNEPTVLDAPVLSVTDTTPTSFTVAWDAVEGADLYTYELGDERNSTEETSVSFTGLASDSTYTVRVKSVSTSSSVESEWAEIDVTLTSEDTPDDPDDPDNPDNPDTIFNMEVIVDGYSVQVRTSPEDKTLPYYFEPIPASYIAAENNDVEAFFDYMLYVYTEEFGGGDAALAFETIAMTGDQNKIYDLTQYGQIEAEYYVIAAGIDETMSRTTAVESKIAEIELPVSENGFTITVDELTQSSITVTVIPSNSDPYAMILMDKSTVDGLSQEQLNSQLLSQVSENNLCQNQQTMIYNRNISPSHDYSLLVFGYQDGVMTTGVTRKDITTPDPEVVEDLTFEFYIEVAGPYEVYVEVTPSNSAAAYFFDIVTLEDWESKYKDDPSLYVKNSWYVTSYGWTESDYLEQFGSTGLDYATYDSYYISPNTDYVLFAFGYSVASDGTVTYLSAQSETFTTPGETGGGDEGGDPSALSFDFMSAYSEQGEDFMIIIEPSDKNTDYVYAVMTDIDYDDYYPDMEAYFMDRYEASGSTGTFAEYIQERVVRGDYEGLASGFWEGYGTYKLVAVGVDVDVDANQVVFYTPGQMDGWYENW